MLQPYVILEFPESINLTTATKKEGYWIVYNFKENSKTRLLLNGVRITGKEAEDYEIRYYQNNKAVFVTGTAYRTDYTESLFAIGSIVLFSAAMLAIGK